MRVVSIIFAIWTSTATLAFADDPHAEMAAALEAQADLHPGPAMLPTRAAAPRHAATASAVRRGLPAHAADAGARAAAQSTVQPPVLVHQAQAAAAAAAGQTQAQAARQRVSHHPTNH